MPFVDYSILGNGTTWVNGRFNKQFFVAPSLSTLLMNLKRVIVQNQEDVFEMICDQEGITFSTLDDITPAEAVKIFPEDRIHFGLYDDPNGHALFINASLVSSSINSNMRVCNYEVRITVNTGAGEDLDIAFQFSTVYLNSLQTIIEAMIPNELIFGWPGAVEGRAAVTFGINGDTSATTTTINSNRELGVSPELIFNFTVFPVRKRN